MPVTPRTWLAPADDEKARALRIIYERWNGDLAAYLEELARVKTAVIEEHSTNIYEDASSAQCQKAIKRR